jgi:hypothetical protein
MVSSHFLGFIALGLAVLGLVAMLVEVGVKSPAALLDIVLDSRALALPEAQAKRADRVTIGYVAPRAPANADRRAAA